MAKLLNSKGVSARRLKAISLINQGLVHSQSDLVSHLKKAGFNVTQATASRDLEEIGAVRGRSADGGSFYEIRGTSDGGRSAKIQTDLILGVESSGNLAVIRTPPGGAHLLASSLDGANLSSIIGTIAGDDTVLVIAKKSSGGGELAKELLALTSKKSTTAQKRK